MVATKQIGQGLTIILTGLHHGVMAHLPPGDAEVPEGGGLKLVIEERAHQRGRRADFEAGN